MSANMGRAGLDNNSDGATFASGRAVVSTVQGRDPAQGKRQQGENKCPCLLTIPSHQDPSITWTAEHVWTQEHTRMSARHLCVAMAAFMVCIEVRGSGHLVRVGLCLQQPVH